MSTSYFRKQRKEGSPVKLGWNNTFTQQETFETTVTMFPSGRTWLEQYFHKTEKIGVTAMMLLSGNARIGATTLMSCGWSKRRHFIRHLLHNPLENGRATRRHDIEVQILANVSVAYHVLREREEPNHRSHGLKA